jgi:hypothetical protein
MPGHSSLPRADCYRIASQARRATATQIQTTKTFQTSLTAAAFCGAPQLVQFLKTRAALIGVPHFVQKFIAVNPPLFPQQSAAGALHSK